MATPRKHWLRLYESLLDEDWDDAVVATVVRLMCWLNRRWARNGIPHEEAGRATIPMLQWMHLCRLKRAARAHARLRQCAAAVSLRYTIGADSVTIDWPKFAILQDYGSRTRPVTGQSLGTDCPETALSDSENSSLPLKTEEESARRSPLLNLLTRLPGTEAEKSLWLEETGPQLEVDSTASQATKRPRTVPQLVVAYYRQYLSTCERDRLLVRPFEQKAKDRAAVARFRARTAERTAYESGPPPPTSDPSLLALLDPVPAKGGRR